MTVANIEIRPATGKKGRAAIESGNLDEGMYWAGMIQGLIHDIPTVAELVHRIVAAAEAIIEQRLARMTAAAPALAA